MAPCYRANPRVSKINIARLYLPMCKFALSYSSHYSITSCIMSLCNQPTLLLRKSGILSIKKFQLAHSITAYIMGYVYLFDTKQPYLHISMLEYESIIEKLYNLCNTLYNNCTEVLHIGHAAGPL